MHFTPPFTKSQKLGQESKNRDCPAKIGTVGNNSVERLVRVLRHSLLRGTFSYVPLDRPSWRSKRMHSLQKKMERITLLRMLTHHLFVFCRAIISCCWLLRCCALSLSKSSEMCRCPSYAYFLKQWMEAYHWPNDE